jgi:hypothetical protein
MNQLALPLTQKSPQPALIDRRRRQRVRKETKPGSSSVYEYQYAFDQQGRRVLVGLSHEETAEFEALEGQLPMAGAELRWLELFGKHERSRKPVAA